jgi:protein SCO1
MKNSLSLGKVWILLGILFLPAIVYYLLSRGEHRYLQPEIFGPRYFVGNSDSEGGEDTLYHTIPAFEFTNFDRTTVSEETFRNKMYVAAFVFTTCPTICPAMSGGMARIQHEYKDDPDLLLLSHTVNPVHDTVEVMAGYASRFGAMAGKWFMVTGSKESIYDLARKGYFLTTTEGDGGEHDFIHSEMLVLVDKEGRIRGYYDGTDKLEVKRLIDEISVLRYHYKKKVKK